MIKKFFRKVYLQVRLSKAYSKVRQLSSTIFKWSYCSWRHFSYRCYPTTWDEAGAKMMGIAYRPNYWHCEKCNPCGDLLGELFYEMDLREELENLKK